MPKSLAQFKADAKAEGWSDWIKSEADERAVLNGCWFDPDAGTHWCNVMEKYLRFTRNGLDGVRVGQPYRLIPYQRNDILMPLFGWKRDRAEGRRHLRRYTKGDVFVAKKQAKSTLCGALCDTFLLKGPPRTEVYGVAHSSEQAGVIYREAEAFAKGSPELQKRLKPNATNKRIVYEEKGSFYQALAGENGARSAEGIIPTLILFDEIHVQRDRTLYDALAYACLATENSLFLSVSTVGVADETTIWWEQYSYAKGILDGSLPDDERFAYIAQADEGCKDSPEMRADPEQWRKAMPALGITVPEEKVAAAVQEAENSPAKLNNLLRYVFNIPTAQIERVIPMDKWAACEMREMPDLTGRECVPAYDGASHEDLTALVLYFPPIGDEERGYLKSWFWCPEEKIREREQKQMAHYGVWAKDGFIRTTPGAMIDGQTIVREIRQLSQTYRMSELYYDPWGADEVVNGLQYDVQCIRIEQGPTGMSGYCQTFLDFIVKQKLWHDGNPVMTWCCSNTAGESPRPDVLWFSKKKSAEKIDGAVAGAMAVGRGATKPREQTTEFFLI
jgi:phage terminase large subunit-like protein